MNPLVIETVIGLVSTFCIHNVMIAEGVEGRKLKGCKNPKVCTSKVYANTIIIFFVNFIGKEREVLHKGVFQVHLC